MTGRTAAIILAAGLSRRLPGNKLVTALNGKAMIRHVAEAALASRAGPVIVVTGHGGDAVGAALTGLPVMLAKNPAYAEGLSTSLRCGISQIPGDCAGAVILLGDMPFITARLIDTLIGAFDPACGIAVPVKDGRRGNPVLWGRRFFAEMATLTGDQGAKSLMGLHQDAVIEVEVDSDAIFADIDRLEDLPGNLA